MTKTPEEIAVTIASEVIKDNASEIYNDSIKNPLSETSKLISRIPKAINAAFAPIDVWIAKREYNVEETKLLLSEKLKFVDTNKIVAPEPYVAVPAIQAISYSMDSGELRDMFANLLAASINEDKRETVHPSFVEIIKQLSPDDAKILKYFKSKGSTQIPKCKLRYQQKTENNPNIFRDIQTVGHNIFKDLILYDEDPNKVEPCLNNLERLGLIKIDDSYHLTNNDFYIDFCNIPTVKHLKGLSISNPSLYPHIFPFDSNYERELVLIKGTIFITSLGEQFIFTCIS